MAIGPGVRCAAQTAKSFLPGAYAEELRTMAERRRRSPTGVKPYDAILLPTMAVPAIARRGRRDLADPGYLTRPATISACAASPAVRPVGRTADRHHRSSASRSPNATC